MLPSQQDAEKNTQEPTKKTTLKHDILQLAFIIIFIIIPFRIFIAQPFIVNGTSMQPGFQDKDYLIVDQVTYRFQEPERGDVIVFRYPNNPSVHYIKRIIGLPGETVTVKDQEVYIEQAGSSEKIQLEEPYIESFRPENSRTTLLDDQYYVMGDNRLVSSDSRVWGPLDEKYITGRALVRLLPFNNINLFPEAFDNYPVFTQTN